MSKHSVIKTSLGIGLMAASLGASSADLHTFAEPVLYYKVNGNIVNYTAFVPSMTTSAGVLLLEMYQSSTISTWAYGLGGTVNAAAGGAGWSFSGAADAATGSVQFSTLNAAGIGSSEVDSTNAASFSSSWYGGDTAGLKLSFTQQGTVSSVACDVTFSATLDTNDYMQYASFSVQPDTWTDNSATDDVYWRTKTGTTASDTASVGSAAWNAKNFSATSSFYTFSAFSIPIAGAAGNTVAASAITKANLCTNLYTAKNALNSAGNIIGGKSGLMRLW